MIKSQLKRIIIGGALGLAVAGAFWRLSPRIYEGVSQVFINSSNGKTNDEMTALLSLGIS